MKEVLISLIKFQAVKKRNNLCILRDDHMLYQLPMCMLVFQFIYLGSNLKRLSIIILLFSDSFCLQSSPQIVFFNEYKNFGLNIIS